MKVAQRIRVFRIKLENQSPKQACNPQQNGESIKAQSQAHDSGYVCQQHRQTMIMEPPCYFSEFDCRQNAEQHCQSGDAFRTQQYASDYYCNIYDARKRADKYFLEFHFAMIPFCHANLMNLSLIGKTAHGETNKTGKKTSLRVSSFLSIHI